VEYGEAITDVAARQALEAARELQRSHGERSLREVASEAIARVYCVCVTDGEDAAEHRFSQVHKGLIDDVVKRLEAEPIAPTAKER
jgi:hypothetical protein